MFLRTNDRTINLKNVSNINIIKDSKAQRYRIVFNMNYSIQINTRGNEKFISDYVYWDSIDENDFDYNLKTLKESNYFQLNFINQVGESGFINVNEISSIKYSEKKNRVIFNLSHPVTFTDFNDNNKITSEFVYVNCRDEVEYDEYTTYVQQTLGGYDGN